MAGVSITSLKDNWTNFGHLFSPNLTFIIRYVVRAERSTYHVLEIQGDFKDWGHIECFAVLIYFFVGNTE